MPALSLAVLTGLAHACAPQVASATLLAVVQAESGRDPLTISVNGSHPYALHPSSFEEARRRAAALLRQGADVDLGLAQINRRNLARLGLSPSGALDACANLAGGARILQDAYGVTRRSEREPQIALRAALSIYNTGDPGRGLRNGYVARVTRIAFQEDVPALSRAPTGAMAAPQPLLLHAASPSPANPAREASAAARSALDVFAGGSPSTLVWTTSPRRAGQAPLALTRLRSSASSLGAPS